MYLSTFITFNNFLNGTFLSMSLFEYFQLLINYCFNSRTFTRQSLISAHRISHTQSKSVNLLIILNVNTTLGGEILNKKIQFFFFLISKKTVLVTHQNSLEFKSDGPDKRHIKKSPVLLRLKP